MNVLPCVWSAPPERLESPANEVHVWHVPLDVDQPTLDSLPGFLAPDECARAERFRFPVHRNRFIVARGQLRKLLGRYLGMEPAELRFVQNAHGKPCLAPGSKLGGLRFNVTHSEELALFAVTRDREVGVDLERIRPERASLEVAERFFSPREVAALRALPKEFQTEGFFNCWTRKEAYLKGRGLGLSMPLDQFDVSLAPGEPAVLLSTRHNPAAASIWMLQDLAPSPGYAAALAVEGKDWRLQCWRY